MDFLPLAQAQPGPNYREIIDNLARTPLSQVVAFVVVLSVIRLGLSPILAKSKPHLRGPGYMLTRLANEILDAFIYAGVFVFMVIRPFFVQAFLIPSGSMWPTLYVNDFIVANKAIYRFSDPQHGDIVVFRPPVTAVQRSQDVDADGQVKVDFIKRCIGIPGDVIEMRDGVLYRNKEALNPDTNHYSECVDTVQNENCENFRELNEVERKGLTRPNFKLVEYHGEIIPLNSTSTDVNAPAPHRDFSDIGMIYGVAQKFQFSDQDEARKLLALPPMPVPKGFYLMMGDNRNGSFDSRGWGLVPRDSIIGRSEATWLPLSRLGRTK